MSYNFSNLSPADFEDLSRDLIGKELGVRFEGFASGPDGGIDGRHSRNGCIILQAKHYVGSTYANLKSAIKKERSSIDALNPQRYILVTSRPLTPTNKAELGQIIGLALRTADDIYTPTDLNSLLRKHDDVHKSHLKLWLSELAVLDVIVHAAAEAFNDITRDEIEAKVNLYAINPSFSEASSTLASQHVVIISGPPGVGKTTLAEMLAFTHVGEGWHLRALRNLDDGFAKIKDSKRQVFLFDDFLGKIALDQKALAHKDSELARFIRRVAKSPNARFILTTRAYIFEEARRVSEHLADQRLEIAKYVLDVGKYTRRIKSRILYNHLLVAGTPQEHIDALIDSGLLPKIVDHKHYNPRIIEFMTDGMNLVTIDPVAYPKAFVEALDHPDMIWDIAFRTHISRPCQNFLFCLFFLSEWYAEITDLKDAFEIVHPRLSALYGVSYSPKDFEDALKTLEGGFITIANKNVRFINPSLKDYLSRYLNDRKLLIEFASAAYNTRFANAVWQHVKSLKMNQGPLNKVALAFMSVAQQFMSEPVFVRRQEGYRTYLEPYGLSNSDRIELLLEWFDAGRDETYWRSACHLAQTARDGYISWRDGRNLVKLVWQIRDGDYFDDLPDPEMLADALEVQLVVLLDGGIASDEIEGIADAIDEHAASLGPRVEDALSGLILTEIQEIKSVISDINSEHELDSHEKVLKRLAPRTAATIAELEAMSKQIEARKVQIEEGSVDSSSPSAGSSIPAEQDKFDDAALTGLFLSLRSA